MSSEARCPHCLRKIKLTDLRFFCVTDDDRRHEVSLSIVDRFKKRLPVCKRNFCKNHGLTVREVECKHCGEQLPPQILFHDKFLSFCRQVKLFNYNVARAEIFRLALDNSSNEC